jgi:C_GCAxxG_C_C family probable redox protein
MKHEDCAAALFSQGFSCSQAVCTAFSEELGFEREQALRIASAFGGGMGHNDELCGVVSGGLMVIGMKHGRVQADDLAAKEKCHALAGDFFREFRDKHGSIRCTDLLGCNLSTDEGMEEAREKNLFSTRCLDLVRDAVRIIDHLL